MCYLLQAHLAVATNVDESLRGRHKDLGQEGLAENVLRDLDNRGNGGGHCDVSVLGVKSWG